MARYIGRRVLASVVVIFVVASLTFFGLRLAGPPAAIAQLRTLGASPAQIASARRALGFDRPLVVQWGSFLSQIARGDLGKSTSFDQSNWTIIRERLPYTLQLAGAAILIVIVFSIPLGVAAATWSNSTIDRAIQGFNAAGQAVPSFVIGPLLILVFAVHWRLFPVSGTGGLPALVLPAVALAIYPLAQIARLLRGSMLETFSLEHVAAARAKGLPELAVITKHVLRNALLPVVTLLGLQIAALLGGAVIVESIFGWPGIGRLSVQALTYGDFPLAQAIVIVMTVIVVGVNLCTDLLYSVVDPRIRLTR